MRSLSFAIAVSWTGLVYASVWHGFRKRQAKNRSGVYFEQLVQRVLWAPGSCLKEEGHDVS